MTPARGFYTPPGRVFGVRAGVGQGGALSTPYRGVYGQNETRVSSMLGRQDHGTPVVVVHLHAGVGAIDADGHRHEVQKRFADGESTSLAHLAGHDAAGDRLLLDFPGRKLASEHGDLVSDGAMGLGLDDTSPGDGQLSYLAHEGVMA